MEKVRGSYPADLPNHVPENLRMPPAPRSRKSAAPQAGRTVKASLLVDVETHARWSAAASLGGMTNNAFAVEALKAALKGIVVVDRRKSGDPDRNQVSDDTSSQD